MLVYYSKTLHSPMYFFLSQLCLSDIMLTTDITPNMLNIVLHGQSSISFSGCIFQFCCYSIIEGFECYLLTVMSYDRYLAICSPLHYTCIMKQTLCIKLVLASWIFSFFLTFLSILEICQLEFCGPNVIDYLFCDLFPVVELSCSDISRLQMEITLLGFPVLILPFLVIVASYIYIVLTILKISSFSGRMKSFSTCSSHLIVVFLFYGTLIATYLIPKEGQSRTTSKIISLLYIVFTPFVNPFIYSLRNKDIKEIVNKVILKTKANYSKP
ncbi:olfactory receptor 1468-like [Aquarana catesbeiana]|uniref:olfactory receptor 1468-like n=1 Tax=Aquarana catesbeiana TaxID=8400 RepID=UPI003CC998E3